MKMKMKMKLSSSTKTSVCLLACTAAAAGFVQLQPQFGAAATKKLFLASMADSKQLPANVLQVADGELRSELASGFGSIGTEFQSLAASIGVPGTLPPPPVVAPLPPLPSGPFSSVSDASLAGGCLPQLRAEPGPNTNNFFVRNFDIAKYGGFEGQRRNHNKGYNQIEGY